MQVFVLNYMVIFYSLRAETEIDLPAMCLIILLLLLLSFFFFFDNCKPECLWRSFLSCYVYIIKWKFFIGSLTNCGYNTFFLLKEESCDKLQICFAFWCFPLLQLASKSAHLQLSSACSPKWAASVNPIMNLAGWCEKSSATIEWKKYCCFFVFFFYCQEVLFKKCSIKWNSEVRVFLSWYIALLVLVACALKSAFRTYHYRHGGVCVYVCVSVCLSACVFTHTHTHIYVHQHQTLYIWGKKHVPILKCSYQTPHFVLKVDVSNFLFYGICLLLFLCLINILLTSLLWSVLSHWLWICVLLT